jgi:hypothetical protein
MLTMQPTTFELVLHLATAEAHDNSGIVPRLNNAAHSVPKQKELLPKRPNLPDEGGELAAAASLSFKNTMPAGFLGSPQGSFNELRGQAWP